MEGVSGIVKGDLKSLKGKKIATSFGTINHLYILALLEKAGLTPQDVTLVNTPPPDMTVVCADDETSVAAGRFETATAPTEPSTTAPASRPAVMSRLRNLSASSAVGK